MKILQLNAWMGKIEGNLRRFLENNEFDVICMQEVFASSDREEHLSRLCLDLPQIVKASDLDYIFFSPNWKSQIAGGTFEEGNLILSRIPFVEARSEFINGEYKSDMVLGKTIGNNLNIQIAKLENGFTVVNHHGFWRPSPTGDEESIKAFAKVGAIVKDLTGPLVMCGDLNVIYESPAMRALDFLRDLTHENHITNTLSGLGYNGEVACDHILISELVKAKNFRVHPDVVSDHLALSVEVETI